MLILAVETSGEVCSVAVRDDHGILAERGFRHRMRLSERLVGDVDEVLKDAGADLESVDGLAVGIGPGSFTGLRVGVATVKTWAWLLQKPVVGVSSLEAVAAEYAGLDGALVVPMIRNRPDSIHMQQFQSADDDVTAISEPETVLVEEVGLRLSSHSGLTIFCGDGVERHRDQLSRQFPAGICFGRPESPRAPMTAAIALNRLREGYSDPSFSLVPLYVALPAIGPAARTRK